MPPLSNRLAARRASTRRAALAFAALALLAGLSAPGMALMGGQDEGAGAVTLAGIVPAASAQAR